MTANLENEKAVLGGLMSSPEILNENIDGLSEECFTTPRHLLIFQAILTLYKSGEGVDILKVNQELVKQRKGNDNGTLEYLRSCFDSLVNPIFTSDHCEAIIKAAKQRKFKRLGNILTETAEFTEPETTLAEIAKVCNDVGIAESSVIHISEVSSKTYSDLEDKDSEPKRYKTGFADIDRRFSIEPSDFVVLGGSTSHGKSAFMSQIALNMVTSGKHKALMVSLEMSAKQNTNRLLAQVTGVKLDIIAKKYGQYCSQAEWEALKAVRANIENLPLWFSAPKKKTLDDILMLSRGAINKYGVDIVFVDYLQKVYNNRKGFSNDEGRIREISGELRQLALSENIVVFAAAQLNRQGSGNREAKTSKELRPRITDFKGSGYIEQDASSVLLIWQPEKYGLDVFEYQGADISTINTAEIIEAKQRDGESGGSCLLTWQGECVKYHNYQQETGFTRPNKEYF